MVRSGNGASLKVERQNGMQWVTWWIGDYLKDTSDLSLMEHGAYRLLLDHYYSTDGRLKADMVSLYRICRAMTDEEQAAVGKVVRVFFSTDAEGMLRNKKADEVLAEAKAFVKAKSEAGKKGAEKRWNGKGNGETMAQPMAQASISQWQNDSHPHPLLKTKEGGQKPARPELEFIFTEGLGALCEQGHTEAAARAVLGKLVKDFGEGKVSSALTAAMGKADVKSYAMAILRGEQKAAAAATVRRLAI